MDNTVISPRVIASRAIKKFLTNNGLKSIIRSKMNQKEGSSIKVIVDELSVTQRNELNILVNDLMDQHQIFHIVVHERIPF